jgi:hypothetical protein
MRRAERCPMVPEMHEFPGNRMTGVSLRRHGAVTTPRIGRSSRRVGRKMSKSFAVRGFPMLSLDRVLSSTVSCGQLSTPTGSFSTQAGARFQLRDLLFVSSYSASGYLTTGVETRSSVAFAPTIPNRIAAPRAHRRIAKYRPTFVSRPS